MIKVICALFFLGMIFPQDLNDDYIVFQADAIGHNNIYLNKINPYKQSAFNVGAIELRSQINNVPMARMLPDMNFIGTMDSSAIVSQFKYNRGDYAYRETAILVKNSLSDQADILFNIQGRKNPAYFESDFINIDEYVVQNLLFDFSKKSSSNDSEKFFRLTKHFNKENSQNDFYTESNNLGLEYRLATSVSSVYANLSNLIYSIFYEDVNTWYDYEYVDFDFEYIFKKDRHVKPFFNFEYDYISKDWNFESPDDLKLIAGDNDLISVELGLLSKYDIFLIKHDFELSMKSNISNETILHSDINFDYKTFYKSWKARIKKFYSYNNMYGQYVYNYNLNGPFNTFRIYKESYILTQIGWEQKDLEVLISNYNVQLEENENFSHGNLLVPDGGDTYIFDKSGDFMEIQIFYNKDRMKFVSPDLTKDIVELKLNGLYYSDYSPIRKYRTVDLNFTFKKQIEKLFNITIDLYVPYAGLSFSKLKFNENYGFRIGNGTFVETESSNQIDYTLFNYEIGLIFKNFIISYKFLNNTYADDYAYQFPSETSDIFNPIYNMKYLSVIWKFDN